MRTWGGVGFENMKTRIREHEKRGRILDMRTWVVFASWNKGTSKDWAWWLFINFCSEKLREGVFSPLFSFFSLGGIGEGLSLAIAVILCLWFTYVFLLSVSRWTSDTPWESSWGTATHRNTLQHAATHCNTLQRTTQTVRARACNRQGARERVTLSLSLSEWENSDRVRM